MKPEITEVRVFIDRATITRRVALPTGGRTAIFEPLPADVDVTTLHARAYSAGGPVLVHGVTTRPTQADAAGGAREVARKIREIDAELATLRDDASSAARRAQCLEHYAGIATDTLSREWLEKNPDFDKWDQSLDLLRAAWVDRAEREIRTKTTKDELLRRKADLLERKAALGTPGHVGWRAEVEVEPREEATFVELHATTRSAQWMPVYDVRVETAASGEETLVLDAFALLKNATGEDWRDVVLVVTTVRPKLSEPLPELRRMVVSARAGAASQSLAIGASGGRTLHTGIDPSGSEEDQIEHTAPGKVDVPASGNPARIRLFGATLPADTRLEIAPLETTVGSWVASAANTSGKVLLPGLVRVFRGRSYAGRSQIGFVVPGQRFRLAIGHDAACRVERKVIRSAREEKLTGGCVERFSNRTSIENPGASRLRLLLRDRVPVSRTSDVTVKIVEQPSGLSIEEESGLTALEIDLAPRERKLLETVWTVKTPAELTLPVPERL